MSSRIGLALLIAALASGLSGCVSALNRQETLMHYEAAQRFDLSGDYISARKQYWMALVNAKMANASPATISMLTYNFGRTTGYTCHIEEAEKYLLDALEMEKSVTGPESGIYTKRLFELARLYFDQEQFAKSASYYAQGIPLVEKIGIEKSDPISLADALDEYSTALKYSGQASLATDAKRRSFELREQNSGKKKLFVPARYTCPKIAITPLS